jgi:hypothetical protein
MIQPVEYTDRVIRRVAIIDDDPGYAEGTGVVVEDAKLEPILLSGGFETIEALVEAVSGSADGVLCDHRLQQGGYAPFVGAEAVARLTTAGVPAVLLTMYDKIDADVSIRLWREHVPVLLGREDADPGLVRRGLEVALREINGDVQDSRRAWPALIEVRAVSTESGSNVLDVMIEGWRPLEAVRFPEGLLPVDLQGHVAADDLLVAEINLGADRAEDLYFRRFRRALEPMSEERLGASHDS